MFCSVLTCLLRLRISVSLCFCKDIAIGEDDGTKLHYTLIGLTVPMPDCARHIGLRVKGGQRSWHRWDTDPVLSTHQEVQEQNENTSL